MSVTGRIPRARRWRGARLLVAFSLGLMFTSPGTPPGLTAGAAETQALPLVWDVSGASGQPDAVLLNPAAAVGLTRSLIATRMATGPEGSSGPAPVYTVALMDSGGALPGGLVGMLQSLPGGGQSWQVSYTVAGHWRDASVGASVSWVSVRLQDGTRSAAWYADTGLVGELGSRARLGLAVYRLKLGGTSPHLKAAGRLGVMLAMPGPAPWLVGFGVAADDLTTMRGRTLEAGMLVPLGRTLQLSTVFQQPLDGDAPGSGTGSGAAGPSRWGAGVSLDLKALRLQLGYQSSGVYLAGLQADL